MNTFDHESDGPLFTQDTDTIRRMGDLFMRAIVIHEPQTRVFYGSDEFMYARGVLESLAWVLMRDEAESLMRFSDMLTDRLTEYTTEGMNADAGFRDRGRQMMAIDRAAVERVRKRLSSLEDEVTAARDDAEKNYLMCAATLTTGCCQKCGRRHPANHPHDPTTPLFRLYAVARHGRIPIWDDAVADCDEPTQGRVLAVLRRYGMWPEVKPLTPEIVTELHTAVRGDTPKGDSK